MNSGFQNAYSSFESIFDSVRDSILILDQRLRILSANSSFLKRFSVSKEETANHPIFSLHNGQWDFPELRDLLETILSRNSSEGSRIEHRFDAIGGKSMVLDARRLPGNDGMPDLIQLIIEDVTAQKNSQRGRARSEERYRRFVENVNSIIIGVDADGTITYFNRFSEKLFGYSRDEVTGKPFVGTIIPRIDSEGNDNSRMWDDIVKNPKNYYTNESEILRRDGIGIRISWSAHAERDQLGNVTEILVDGKDVTEITTRAALDESRQRLVEVLESMPDAFVSFDKHLRYTYANTHAERMQGVQREEILGKDVRALYPDPESYKTISKYEQVLRTGEPVTDISFHAGYDLWVEIRAFPTPAGVSVFFKDVSSQIEAAYALRQSEEKFRAVFEQAAVGIGRVSFHDAKWIDVNAAFCSILGYSAEEFKATPWPEITHPNDIDLDLIPFKQMAAGDLDSYSVEKRFIHKKGHHSWARLTLSLVRDEEGRPDYEIAIIEDINERKTAEQTLQRRTEELAAANGELESFSYSVSHDLRSPLNSIGGFSTALREDYAERLDDEGKDYLHRIDHAVHRMANIIDDMLTLSRVGRHEMSRIDLDLSARVDEYLKELKDTAPERSCDFSIQPNVHAFVDPRLITLALENLLRNAWKFSSKKECACIEFGTFEQDETRVCFVRDNGAGFPKSQAKELFKPFRRLHSQREFDGTGVGLPIVERVIARHGGRVWAEGEEGKGATFYFTLGTQESG